MTVKEIHTNKAKLIFKENGTVEKVFFDSGVAKNEIKSLSRLNDVFKDTSVDGWIYRAVKLISYDEDDNKIVMKTVNGVNFSEIFHNEPDYVKHMGIWLAAFHNNVRLEDDKVILYGDFNRGNFIIDKEKKEATAIDPGSYFGDVDYPEVDLVTTIYSLVVGVLKFRRSPFNMIYNFVRSYNEISDREIDKINIKVSWKLIQDRFKNKYKKAPVLVRPISYCAMITLNLYITILINAILRKYDKENEHD